MNTTDTLADWIRGEPDRVAAYFDVDEAAKEVIRNGVKKSRPAAIDDALRSTVSTDRDGVLEEAANTADRAIKDFALTNTDGNKSPGSCAAVAYNAIRALKK